jgi:hypothetical protein
LWKPDTQRNRIRSPRWIVIVRGANDFDCSFTVRVAPLAAGTAASTTSTRARSARVFTLRL